MAEDQSTLVKAVIRVLNDSAKGFPDIGEHLKDTSKKSFSSRKARPVQSSPASSRPPTAPPPASRSMLGEPASVPFIASGAT